jgi:predicted O-methyltransferase YrrM
MLKLQLPRAGADPKGPLSDDTTLPEPRYFEQKHQVSALRFESAAGGVDWYPGPMIGAQSIAGRFATSPRQIELARDLLKRLSSDDYSIYMQDYYSDGLKRFGDSWNYADLVTVVMGVAEFLKPRNYLEIGVRRGRSVCAVASLAPAVDIAMFDMWIEDYAGMHNPGPEFVLSELNAVGHTGKAEFFNGNSHKTLPEYFRAHPDAGFDMITVDGDHTNLGAAQDIADVIPHVSIGGALIFDDVCHPKLLGLGDVWRRMVVENRRFSAWTYNDVGYGVGFAIRKF